MWRGFKLKLQRLSNTSVERQRSNYSELLEWLQYCVFILLLLLECLEFQVTLCCPEIQEGPWRMKRKDWRVNKLWWVSYVTPKNTLLCIKSPEAKRSSLLSWKTYLNSNAWFSLVTLNMTHKHVNIYTQLWCVICICNANAEEIRTQIGTK